jgi:hypothetical protein
MYHWLMAARLLAGSEYLRMNEEQLRKINEQLKQRAYERQQRRQLEQERQRLMFQEWQQQSVEQQQYWMQQLKEFEHQQADRKNREARSGICEWCGEEKEQIIPLKFIDNPMTKDTCMQCAVKVTRLKARASRHKEERG